MKNSDSSLLIFCFTLLFAILTLHFIALHDRPSLHQDYQPLISFKSTCDDPHNTLSSWNSSTDPCTWDFITCFNNRVSKLNLQNLSLHCSIHPLTSLTHLRVLNLKHNRFNGRIPILSNLQSLNVLILSHNHFSGYFPMMTVIKFRELHHLYYLDLSHNNFCGDIPDEINDLPRIPYNRFSGDIRFFHRDFDISSDQFPGDSPGPAGDVGPNEAISRDTYVISPSERSSTKDMIPKVVVELLCFAIVFLYFFWFKQKYTPKPKEKGIRKKLIKKKSAGPGPGPSPGSGPGGEELVCFEGIKKLNLQDFLRCRGREIVEGFREVTNVVLEDDHLVSVKKFKDAKISGSKELEQYMNVLGKLRHPNVVSLRAYRAFIGFKGEQEMLLLYDNYTRGCLFSLLHEEDGSNKGKLNWIARHRIAAGVGRGLAYIHNSCKAQKLTHGDIQSFNIFMCNNEEPQLAESGLSILAPTILSNGYRAPEELDGQESTQKSDVYSFGVLLLELVTGKCPSVVEEGWPIRDVAIDLLRWVQSVMKQEWSTKVVDIDLMKNRRYEDEIMELLEIAMACCVAEPDERPTMSKVVGMIEDIGLFVVY